MHFFSFFEFLHALIESAEVAVVFGGLHVALPKRGQSQVERMKVKLFRLGQFPLLNGE